MRKRLEFATKIKAAAFERAAGKCEACGAKLFVGRFHYDHVLPDNLGGEPTFANCEVVCVACHRNKTNADVSRIAKARRQHVAHIGAKREGRPMLGSRKSGWMRTFNNGWVRR